MPVWEAEQQWIANHAPAVSLQATASRAAGAAGVKHVCTALSFGLSARTAVAASTVTVNLRDGATGAGTVLASWTFDLVAATLAPIVVSLSGLNLKGSPATAMTLEFGALLANLLEYVNLIGYDE